MLESNSLKIVRECRRISTNLNERAVCHLQNSASVKVLENENVGIDCENPMENHPCPVKESLVQEKSGKIQ